MLEEHQHQQSTHNFDGIVENRVNSPPVYFTVLFYGLILWAVAFCAYFLLSGWSSVDEFQAKLQTYEAKFLSSPTPAGVSPEAAGKPAEPPPAPPQAPEPAAVGAAVATAPATAGQPDAKALYDGKCAMCHGADAKGGFGPDLTAPVDKFEYGKTRQALFMSIGEGRGNGKMPAFTGQLKREEIYALADYILSLK